MAINADNALNNDTLVEHPELLLQHDFVLFNLSDVRMWCMAHIVHLAALEVLDIRLTNSICNLIELIYLAFESNSCG